MSEQRKHAAIMFTDIVGYTRLMGSDEEKAVDMLSRNRSIHQSCIEKFNGTLIKEIGDGILASFSLASEAVRCAKEIQKKCKEQGIPLKVGIHEGEMIFSGSDVIGDGVNIASRLQEDAQEGCINISANVYSNIRNKADIPTTLIGERSYKNVGETIKVYRIQAEESENKGVEGVKQNKSKRSLAYYILASLIILITAILIIWKFIPIRDNIEYEKSIAVRPFWNESINQENEFFVNGMTESIRNNLSKIADLRVVSRGSVEKYKDSNNTNKEIAKELNVTYVLEGTVQRIGDQVMIHTQLIIPETEDHVWEETYRENISDISKIFDIQSQIAQSVAEKIQIVVNPYEKKRINEIPTENKEAYDLYLRGRQASEEEDFKVAIYFYQQAIELDSDFGLAYAWMGLAYSIVCSQELFNKDREKGDLISWENLNPTSCADTMMYYVNKSLDINPDIPDAYYMRSKYWRNQGNFDKSISDLEKAIEINPNHLESLRVLGYDLLVGKRQYIDALRIYNKAIKLAVGTSEYEQFLFSLGRIYLFIGKYAKAEEKFKEMINYNPLRAYSLLCWLAEVSLQWEKYKFNIDKLCELDSGFECHEKLYYYSSVVGDFDEALGYYKNCMDYEGKGGYQADLQHRLGYVLDNLGRKEEAKMNFEHQLNQYRKLKSDSSITNTLGFPLFRSAAIYAYTGEHEKAIEILKELDNNKMMEVWYKYLPSDPYFQFIQEYPELKAISQKQENKFAEIRAEVDRLEAAGEL